MSKDILSATKGRILLALNQKISNFKIPKTEVVSVPEILKSKRKISQILKIFKKQKINKLAIRSSSSKKDQEDESKAGVYKSFLNIAKLVNVLPVPVANSKTPFLTLINSNKAFF